MKKLLQWLLTAYLAVFIMVGTVYAADVVIGPGDVLKIYVYGHTDLTLETKVSASGSITYPLIGTVPVAGLAPAVAEQKIAVLLEEGGYIRKPQVNVIVTLMQSQQVSVLGMVNKPGRYPIDSVRTLTDVLALAGGVNADGGDIVTLIRIRDGKTQRETIDLIEMVRSADFKQNIELMSNDVIYVERAPRFYIYGEVQRPGPYRLERNMTLLQAISAGGGLTPRGTERGIRIKRRNANGNLQILEVTHDDMIRENDVVYVQESLF